MDLNPGKLLAAAILGAAFALSAAAHPDPERHPFDTEMKEADDALRAAIEEGDQQLDKRIDDLDFPNQQAIATLIEKEVSGEIEKAVEGIIQPANEQPGWTTVVISGVAGLAGGFAAGSPLVRNLMKRLRKRPRQREPSSEDTDYGSERENEEREEKKSDIAMYFVNMKRTNGHHEVHTGECSYAPKPENREYLGQHEGCHSAVAKARNSGYPSADGCWHCSRECHTNN